ncbi:hypothetical protein [Actinomadura rupiterrae]|uniref:hypothetical protein n=1 Tax=Actinomadura rupiterrae TaxID=559627 RepID=UPI0020A39802|nr:hypothetical protein [Actinomadura rupiterrae]MCP2342899.1 hypothetical protein [Actinomadura rupiterrae]
MGETVLAFRPEARVNPQPVPEELARLVREVQRVPWPLWTEPATRTRREVAELCRLQTARGLTVLALLALGGREGPGNHPPATDTPRTAETRRVQVDPDVAEAGDHLWRWLTATNRLAGPRQQWMYGVVDRMPGAVRELAVANWTWALGTSHGGQVTSAFLAGGAYPDDGYSAAHATVALLRLWERRPESRPQIAAAWAATRTPADWCKAAELSAAYGAPVPIFSYPRGALPDRTSVRPWAARLFGLEGPHRCA